MAAITYNEQSFAVDNRRLWIVGASMEYARVDPQEWAARLGEIRQCGFNTVLSCCPWMIHEARKGRYNFQDGADVKHFIELCGALDLRVVLRAGPFVGGGYEGGGVPGWITDDPEAQAREGGGVYMERAARFLRKLAAEVAPMLVTNGGPVILVQAEHAWNCSHQAQVDTYLSEITRILRENGINVPIISANDMWPDTTGMIETWRGRKDMLRDIRQLHAVQHDAPRIVSAFEAGRLSTWGVEDEPLISPDQLLCQLAQVLAAGGQPIICPFHGGTSFGFSGGQLPGQPGGSLMTTPVPDAPLGVAGERKETYRTLRRLVQFAANFGHVFAELDPQYQPITLDPPDVPRSGKSRTSDGAFSIVPLRGALGRVVFVFALGGDRQATLLLDNGLRMPIDLGDQPAGWFLLDVDLKGRGTLDYTNLSPVAMVGDSTLVLQGAAKAPAFLSINGTPLQEEVPSGKKPLVVSHQGITVVICSQAQIDWTYDDGTSVYVGVDGFDVDGNPRPAPGYAAATVVSDTGDVSSIKPKRIPKGAAAGPALEQWLGSSTAPQVSGSFPRYATLDGPQTLAASGATSGYGWYRLEIKSSAARTRTVHVPESADRIHMFHDGVPMHLAGRGIAADAKPFELSLNKGKNTIVALVDNLGRLSGGTDVAPDRGLFGHMYEVQVLKAAKPKKTTGSPVDPFELRGYLHHQTYGQISDPNQVTWSFTHAKKTPILVDVLDAATSGTFVLNNEPVAYYPGVHGARYLRVMLQKGRTESFKRGPNTLRFVADPHQENPQADIIKHTTLYECTESITAAATWAFARWEAPADSTYTAMTAAQLKAQHGSPCWWKVSFQADTDPRPLWLDTTGLSKGQVYVNGQNLGRYFTAEPGGRAVGTVHTMHIPASWLEAKKPNELVIFDEHGFAPGKVSLRRSIAAS